MSAIRKNLRPGYLIAAAIFLFNPYVNIVDVLPDCIGYLMILRAIAGVSDLIPHFREAKDALYRLFWFSLVRVPATFMVLGAAASNAEIYALSALAFGVVELVFLFPAIRELFAGFDYIGERFGTPATVSPKSGAACRACYIALAAKPILAFLPELSLVAYDEHVTGKISLATFRPHLTVLAFMVALGFGIYFLTALTPFARALKRDTELTALLSAVRQEYEAPLRGIAEIRRIRFAMGCLTAGAVCMLDLYFDGVNYLPNAFGFASFILFAILLLPLTRRSIPLLICAAAGMLTSLRTYFMRATFFAEYGYHLLGRSKGADELYASLSLSSAIEAGLLIATCMAAVFVLFSVIRDHTGYRADNVNNYSSHLSLHAALRRITVMWAALGSLTAVTISLNFFLRRLTEKVEMNPEYSTTPGVMPIYGWFWLVPCILCIAWIACSAYLAFVVNTETEQKYTLEG